VTPRRRRALLLLSLALASGGLAATQVSHPGGEVERRVGRPVPVVVAARDLSPGRPVSTRELSVRRVPARFVPPGAVASVDEVSGLHVAVPVAAGSYVVSNELEGASARGGRGGGIGRGERAVEVAVAGGEALSESASPGSRVDVLVSTEGGSGRGRSFLALEDVEVMALRAAGGGSTAGAGGSSDRPAPTAVATLRVTLRQAIYVTAAQNFAREVRLLPRPPGDRGRLGREAVGEAGL
jgi:pilus assembly protein CpaB